MIKMLVYFKTSQGALVANTDLPVPDAHHLQIGPGYGDHIRASRRQRNVSGVTTGLSGPRNTAGTEAVESSKDTIQEVDILFDYSCYRTTADMALSVLSGHALWGR